MPTRYPLGMMGKKTMQDLGVCIELVGGLILILLKYLESMVL